MLSAWPSNKRCFGELNDYPPGFARYFIEKALTK